METYIWPTLFVKTIFCFKLKKKYAKIVISSIKETTVKVRI